MSVAHTSSFLRSAGLAITLVALGCATSEDVTTPSSGKKDGGVGDSGSFDSGAPVDTGTGDTSPVDTGIADSTSPEDTGDDGSTDADVDSGDDTSVVDSGDDTSVVDSGDDTSIVDSGDDTSIVDSGDDSGTGGPLKLASGAVLLHGVTTDGFVVYTSGSTTYAVALGGGATKTIATSVEALFISGKVVFTWTAISTSTGYGALSVWTDAWGSKSLATSALVPGDTGATRLVAAASADGQWIAYTDGAAWAGLDDVANIKTAKSDGTSVKTLFSSTIVYDYGGYGESCTPYMRFAGAHLVTTHCSGPVGAVSPGVSSFDPATGTSPTTLGSALQYYPNVDPTGTKVAVVSGGALRVVPAAGGAAVTIDTGTKYAAFTNDGSTILYLTSGNALKRSSTTTPSPTVLVSSGVTDLLSAVSPDDQWILVTGASSSSGYDVRLASTTTPGAPTVLLAATTGDVFGDAFTADSTRALWYGSLDSFGAGTLFSQPIAGGATATLGTGAWISYAISGSKVLWNDDHVGGSTSGTATLKVRDLASGTSDTVIATGADRGYALSAARDKVVYTYASGASQGLWVASIP